MEKKLNLSISQEIKDELDVLLTSLFFDGFSIDKEIHNAQFTTASSFSDITYFFKKNKKNWRLILNFRPKVNDLNAKELYLITFKMDDTNFHISSSSLDDDFMKLLKVIKVVI